MKGEFIEEDDSVNSIKEQKIKEQFLDDAFKKAEVKHVAKHLDNKKIKKTIYEKKFPKLWVLLIVISSIGIIFINYMPWGYVKYDTGDSEIEISITKEFKIYDGSNEITDSEVINDIATLFSEPYYIGLSEDAFASSSNLTFYGCIILIALGIMVVVFGILDRFINFQKETFISIHFILTTIVTLPCILIVLSLTKFLAAQILSYYNSSLINIKIITIAFPAAFFLVITGFILVRLAFTVMKLDFKEMQKILKKDASEPISNPAR